MTARVAIWLLTALVIAPSYGDSIWDKTKEIAGSAAEIAGDTASSVGKAVQGEEESPEAVRSEIDRMAAATLEKLLKKAPGSNVEFDKAPAYAVFDTRKMSLLITTGFGSGVAIDKKTGHRVYMKMASGGVNIGMGAQLYRVVFLFPSQARLEAFVTQGWDAGADADAAAGKDAESLSLRLPDGTIVYKLNEKGVMLSATLTGTKYWQWDELNTPKK